MKRRSFLIGAMAAVVPTSTIPASSAKGLLRDDEASRKAFSTAMMQNGWLTRKEVLAKEFSEKSMQSVVSLLPQLPNDEQYVYFPSGKIFRCPKSAGTGKSARLIVDWARTIFYSIK